MPRISTVHQMAFRNVFLSAAIQKAFSNKTLNDCSSFSFLCLFLYASFLVSKKYNEREGMNNNNPDCYQPIHFGYKNPGRELKIKSGCRNHL